MTFSNTCCVIRTVFWLVFTEEKICMLLQECRRLKWTGLKQFLAHHNICTDMQSGCRACFSSYSNHTGKKWYYQCPGFICWSAFSISFNSVGHKLLLNRLSNIEIGDPATKRFRNYLKEHAQHISTDCLKSNFWEICKVSILAPILFSLFINNIASDLKPLNWTCSCLLKLVMSFRQHFNNVASYYMNSN